MFSLFRRIASAFCTLFFFTGLSYAQTAGITGAAPAATSAPIIQTFDAPLANDGKGNTGWERLQRYVVQGCGPDGSACLRVPYVACEGGTRRFSAHIAIPPAEEYTMEYWVYFEPGFVFVQGGKILGLGTAEHKRGCGTSAVPENWEVRMMWRPKGTLTHYMSVKSLASPPMRGVSELCGYTHVDDFYSFTVGEWQRVTLYVKVNTPGMKDGSTHIYLNGTPVSVIDDIELRGNVAVNEGLAERILFHTFFGGSGSDWAPPQTVYARFDNISVTAGKTDVTQPVMPLPGYGVSPPPAAPITDIDQLFDHPEGMAESIGQNISLPKCGEWPDPTTGLPFDSAVVTDSIVTAAPAACICPDADGVTSRPDCRTSPDICTGTEGFMCDTATGECVADNGVTAIPASSSDTTQTQGTTTTVTEETEPQTTVTTETTEVTYPITVIMPDEAEDEDTADAQPDTGATTTEPETPGDADDEGTDTPDAQPDTGATLPEPETTGDADDTDTADQTQPGGTGAVTETPEDDATAEPDTEITDTPADSTAGAAAVCDADVASLHVPVIKLDHRAVNMIIPDFLLGKESAFAQAERAAAGITSATVYCAEGQSSSGDPLDPESMTAAMSASPVGAVMKVEHEGSTIYVTINNRDGAGHEKNIDLTGGAAKAIGNFKPGGNDCMGNVTDVLGESSHGSIGTSTIGGTVKVTFCPELTRQLLERVAAESKFQCASDSVRPDLQTMTCTK